MATFGEAEKVTGPKTIRLAPGDEYTDWLGITRPVPSTSQNYHLAVVVSDEAVAWAVYSVYEIAGRECVSLQSAYTLPERRQHGYFEVLLLAISTHFPDAIITGRWANKRLHARVMEYNARLTGQSVGL